MAQSSNSELWRALRPVTVLAAAILAVAIIVMDMRTPATPDPLATATESQASEAPVKK